MSKDTFWFRHDSNARNDPKMCQLLMIGGQAAKGSFWDIVEILRESDGYKIPLDKLPAIAFACRFPDDAIDQMVQCGLIERDDKHVWSRSLNRRMKKLDAIKKKRAAAGRKGGKAKAGGKQMPDNSLANGKQNPSKAKRSDLKGSDLKGSDLKDSLSPTMLAAKKLCDLFLVEIRKENPNSTAKISDAWVTDMDRLIRLDHRTSEQIEKVIKWTTHDSFWASNVLCPNKLREKFDQLQMKMSQPAQSNLTTVNQNRMPPAMAMQQRNREILDQIEREEGK
jgi:hypothetical protein